MRKFTIVTSMIALVGALLTPTTANAALRVPKTSWPVCTTAAQDFCVESVSVSLNAGAAIPLTWVASGTATPVTAAPVAPAAPATADTKTVAPAAADTKTAAPAPAAPVIPTPLATTEASPRAGIDGRWTHENWAVNGLAVYGYDGLYINAKTANEFVNWVMIDVLPVKVDATNKTSMAGQVGANTYQAPLDRNIFVSIKVRVGPFKNGVSVSIANDISVDATGDATRNTLLVEGSPVSTSLQASTKQCEGETGKATASTVQMLVIIVPSNDDASGFGIDGISGEMSVASNGGCKLSTPVWNAETKSMVWTVAAPHFAPDGVTENIGFYKARIPAADAKLLWGLQNANDAATALEVSVTSDAGGTNVGQKNITVKNNVIFINVTGFKYSQPKLTVMMNKNYKPGAASAAPAKKVAPKKVITCVKGKVTKKVSTAACPSGYKKK
jgi:hypothetical protein